MSHLKKELCPKIDFNKILKDNTFFKISKIKTVIIPTFKIQKYLNIIKNNNKR